MRYDDFIVPEILPPYEDGVFKTLMTHPEAKPVLRDVVESFLRFPVVNVEVRNDEETKRSTQFAALIGRLLMLSCIFQI